MGINSEGVPADCEAITRIAKAFKELSKQESAGLAALLKQADRKLAPLADPFRLRIAGHRWLDLKREREESYSDWFAWLLKLMDSKQVLQILGLNDKRFGRLVRNKKFKVSREVQCLASEGAPKRLDLVIRFDDGAGVILVEVKVQDLDKAGGHENLVDYCRWLERQGDPNRRYAVLLVQAKPDQDCPGWDVRLWEDVSLNLRWLAMSRVKSRRSARGKSRRSARGKSRRSARGNLLFAAACLCFASAVEQNVLGLDGSGDTLSAPPTKLYLERFLEGIRV